MNSTTFLTASSLASRRSGLVNCFKIGVRYSSRIVFLSNKQNKNYYNFGSLKHVDSVYDIRNLLNVLEGREVKFSPRDLNSLADGLAKLGAALLSSFCFVSSGFLGALFCGLLVLGVPLRLGFCVVWLFCLVINLISCYLLLAGNGNGGGECGNIF
ncbi:hypothetical protein Q3G72_029723 [Acer saccharum]|nr:hypothetical protein Q3G72_029723 [Acer saccharum]